MLGEELSRALSHISDDKIEAAANIKPVGRRHIWVRVASIVAILALLLTWLLWPGDVKTDEDGNIISAPGILRAYACELDDVDEQELEKYELTSDKPFLRAICNPLISTVNFGSPIAFQIPEGYFGTAEITFEISSAYENFCKKQTLKNGESIYFRRVPYKEIMSDVGAEGSFYLDVIILADGKVVGYGVVSFCFYFYSATYAYEFKAVCFPLVDGKFQDVSEEYVWQQIEEYKQSKPYGEGHAIVHQFYEGTGVERADWEGV